MSALQRTPSQSPRLALAFMLGLVAFATAFLPGTADARDRRAVVQSVDGPGLLTVRDGKRTLKLRLAKLDSPRPATATTPAECGADGATSALRILTKKYPRFTYELLRSRGADPSRPNDVRPVRDLDGRLVAEAETAPRRGGYTIDLAARIIYAGWARWGLPVESVGVLYRGTLEAQSSVATGYDDVDVGAALRQRGLWKLCGGRIHLPGGTPPPALAPVPWQIDPNGVLQRIGTAAVYASDAIPAGGRAITLADILPSLPDAEVTTDAEGSCMVWAPASGVQLLALDLSSVEEIPSKVDCPATTLFAAWSVLPSTPVINAAGAAAGSTTTGYGAGGSGGLIADFQAQFRRARLSQSGDRVLFFGEPTGSDDNGNVRPIGLVQGELAEYDEHVWRLQGLFFQRAWD